MIKLMENNSMPSLLIGSEIHGFRTMEELDVTNTMEEAKARWLRPNEIHAILCNYKHFNVNVKPVNLPKSGTIVLFDRKMLRNFRKDGHNWKKKKDGKTVKEAHEHLKVGNEERIHVYYAHGEDNPTFVRRCYWLLDKSIEHIVLVHYRETQEQQGSPVTPLNSHSSSGVTGPAVSWPLSEESESALDQMCYGDNISLLENQYTMAVQNHEQRIHEINTLDWDELLVPHEPHELISPEEGKVVYKQPNQYPVNISDNVLSTKAVPLVSAANQQIVGNNFVNYNISSNSSYESQTTVNPQTMISGVVPLTGTDLMNNLGKEGLQAQDSFGRWMSYIIADTPGQVDDGPLEPSVTEQQSFTSPMNPSTMGQIFNITDISPTWAFSTEETKVLIVGSFNEGKLPPNNLLVGCGDSIYPAEVIQAGVFRCLISAHAAGLVNLFLTFDGHTPVSQVITFEFRAPAVPNDPIPSANKTSWDEFQYQMRLARLLFSSFKSFFSTALPPNSLDEGKVFARRTSHVSNSWSYLTKMIGDGKMSYPEAKDSLFEFTLQNLLRELLLEQVITGCKVSERDAKGQSTIHLCAILGYTWAVYPFSCSGLSLDYRDKFGWTALHWAAYYGREKMVAALLSAGAKPNLVTDPTSENPGGSTAADLASKNGFDGLAAYLAEKALVAQFNDMTLAGNVSGSLQTTKNDSVSPVNFSEDEMYLKDTLAAYRNAADAAARIQAAFREHSLKVRTKAVESSSPEMEARNIVAAMKIQHAFRNYETRKQMAAAARIQHRFRSWKTRRDFLNMRRQAIKIQAFFRGFQVRKQYRKICWSVGVLEKAILRWRLKRKGFRGLQVQSDATIEDPNQGSDVEEDFFKASRRQAEERVERSVVKVQAMFRSRKAQEEYRRMKFEHNKAELEYKGFLDPDTEMGQRNN